MPARGMSAKRLLFHSDLGAKAEGAARGFKVKTLGSFTTANLYLRRHSRENGNPVAFDFFGKFFKSKMDSRFHGNDGVGCRFLELLSFQALKRK